MSYSLSDVIEISPGVKMPRIGFGVYKSPKDTCVRSVNTALETGYRHIDSAAFYANEAEVGEAVRSVGPKIPREELFITTKIFGSYSADDAYKEVVKGVEKFGLPFVDLFLIHTPTMGPEGREVLWKSLEKLKTEGKTRAIGVSNFGVKHLEQLKSYSSVGKPAVNQIEIHPWCQQREIVAYCQKEGIVLQAYCPIVRATKNDHPVVVKLSKKHNVDPGQVLIRWSLQKGYVPLPKSDTPSRIKSNADVFRFELDAEDMAELDTLDEGKKGAVAPNPVDCE